LYFDFERRFLGLKGNAVLGEEFWHRDRELFIEFFQTAGSSSEPRHVIAFRNPNLGFGIPYCKYDDRLDQGDEARLTRFLT
jgi:hypothetical protein